jgi:ParB family chromosome partitioning protein
VTLDDVVAQTGLSATTIKRRLALNGLCKEAKASLAKGELTLSQAEALTLGSAEAQRSILEEIQSGDEFSVDGIRRILLDDRPTVAMAIFPVEQYTGTITTDLFAEDETSYFDDAEQFTTLQKEAVDELVKHHEASAAWVEVTEAHNIPDWQFRKASKRQKGGVLINLSPTGRVEIREGLVRRNIDKQTAAQTMDHPAAPLTRKAAYSSALCAHIAHHKTAAVQEMLLASPRKVREVSVVERLMRFKPHEAIPSLAKESEAQTACAVLEGQARQFAAKLGSTVEEGEPAWKQLRSPGMDSLTVYEAVRGLSDHDLEQLEVLVIALSFGQADCNKLDSRDADRSG